MFLKKIHVLHFKNLKQESFEFSSKLNCFVGFNGVGKTNLLDAIHYLAFGKSFFGLNDQQSIKFGEEFLLIEGIFERKKREEFVSCAIKKGGKKVLKRNEKIYQRLTEHVGMYPLVVISPYDRSLINEGSEVRRRFIDNVISQSDKTYLELLVRYHKTLIQRNVLLKQMIRQNIRENHQLLQVYNHQMQETASEIYEKRKKFIRNFTPDFQEHYQRISNKDEKVSLEYKSTLENRSLYESLEAELQKDLLLGYTSVGIHKDDIELLIKEVPVKRFGSQGQQKSFLIALKLAQFDFMKKQLETLPILLLDDIFDKLDEMRVNQLIDLVNQERFGQIFISDTHAKRMYDIILKMNKLHKIFEIKR